MSVEQELEFKETYLSSHLDTRLCIFKRLIGTKTFIINTVDTCRVPKLLIETHYWI